MGTLKTGRAASGGAELPLQLTPFVNRRREVQALRPLVLEQRLVSIVGPAGTGKTRLALALAGDLARRFPGGLHFVEVGALGEPALLPALVAETVGLSEEGSADPTELLIGALRAERTLLVLDSCEHLVQEAAQLAERLLRGCPGLSVLVTSRERLGVPGELVWRLGPMEAPQPNRRYGPEQLVELDSAILFIDRAWRSQASFRITDENSADVAELLRRLEGLPLAIELAAAWSGTLSPADMVARLDDRFRLLTARQRITNPRHASLRVAIDSSYEALEAAERSLFRRLGLFAGGWTLDSMTSISDGDPSAALAIHARLVDCSLVSAQAAQGGGTRYRMLDSVRGYAVEKLTEAGELETVRERFAAQLLGLVDGAAGRLSGRERRRWLELLDAEHDNFRALLELEPLPPPGVAVRLCAGLSDYWRLRGHYTEARLRLKAALRRSRERTPELVRSLLALGMMAFLQVDRAEGLRQTRRALAVARRIDDRRGMLLALEQLARVLFTSGDSQAARECLESGLGSAIELADPAILSSYRFLLGQVALADERYEEAAELLGQAAELAGRADHGELSALASSMLGRLHLLQGRPDLAGPLLRTILAGVREFGGPRHVVILLDSLAAVAADEGDHERAGRLAGAAAVLHERSGSRPPPNSPIWSQVVARGERALATRAGRKGYEEGRAMELEQAIRFALQEEDRPAARARPQGPASGPRLTRRQVEIARLVGEGLTNREIAQRLFISERTAEGHVEQIRNKLGFSSRVQIAAWIVENERPG